MTCDPTDRQDLEDTLAEIIEDSMDVDWTSRTGARAIIRNLPDEGLAIVAASAARQAHLLNVFHSAAEPIIRETAQLLRELRGYERQTAKLEALLGPESQLGNVTFAGPGEPIVGFEVDSGKAVAITPPSVEGVGSADRRVIPEVDRRVVAPDEFPE